MEDNRTEGKSESSGKYGTLPWIIGIAVFFLVCLFLAILFFNIKPGKVANVYRDGKCIYSVDLSTVTEAYEKTFTDADGHINTIRVEKGRIRMVSANCPDKVCVDSGWISGGAVPVVCLPHRLVIKIEGEAPEGAPDAVVR